MINETLLFTIEFARDPVSQEIRKAHNRIEWGSQLVAHTGEKLALYVAAVLNSSVINAAIKPFQSTGLLGERDVTKKLLELPIPTFDHNNPIHVTIAGLGSQAREQAAVALRSGNLPAATSLARQRAFIRTHLESTLSEIDKQVRKLL